MGTPEFNIAVKAWVTFWAEYVKSKGIQPEQLALLLARPQKVRHLFVEGRQVVRDGQITTLDLPTVVARQNRLARTLSEF